MQASLPQFIDAVKISDVGQGKHPVRIVSIRPLSDREKGGQTKSEREYRISRALNPNGRYWKATENRYIVSILAFLWPCDEGGDGADPFGVFRLRSCRTWRSPLPIERQS